MPMDADESSADPVLHQKHRTVTSILNAFDAACAAGDKAMALRLLGTAEGVIARSMGAEGGSEDALRGRLVASRERLWALKRRKPGASY